MLSFEELVFVNKAKVMFNVTHGFSPIYITETFKIKGLIVKIHDFAFRFKQKF